MILVTGGAGFIGAHIAEELVRRKEKVRILDNFSTGKRENLSAIEDSIELLQGDIRDSGILGRALEGVDCVLHQAAIRSVPFSILDPISTHEVNINGTLMLFELAKKCGVRRVVYASSSSVYGDQPCLPKTEMQQPLPISPYGVSKLVNEHYGKIYSDIYGLETVGLRYFNVFGPRQDAKSEYSAVIPRFIEAAIHGDYVTVYGDGLQTRDFTYIDNVVSANILAMNAKGVTGNVFNIASAERITILDLISITEQYLHKKMLYKHEPERAGDIKHSFAEISKAENYLNYKVKVSFNEGIKRLVEYFDNQGEKKEAERKWTMQAEAR